METIKLVGFNNIYGCDKGKGYGNGIGYRDSIEDGVGCGYSTVTV